MLDTVWMVLAWLGAGAIATVLRFWDPPTDTLKSVTLQQGVVALAGALIAGGFAIWAGNLDPTVWQQFVTVVIASIGGMAGVAGLFTKVEPKQTAK